MRYRVWGVLAAMALCGVIRLTPAQTAPATDTAALAAKTYLVVTADELQIHPGNFADRDVQVADVFNATLRRLPRTLRRYGVTSDTHVAFTTHQAIGSNMLCVVEKSNEEAVKTLDTLVNESPIYLMGRMGPLVEADGGRRALFMVERMVRGSTPPPPPKKSDQQKPVLVTLEIPVRAADGSLTRKRVAQYKIEEMGVGYVIKDPYDPAKDIFLTLQPQK